MKRGNEKPEGRIMGSKIVRGKTRKRAIRRALAKLSRLQIAGIVIGIICGLITATFAAVQLGIWISKQTQPGISVTITSLHPSDKVPFKILVNGSSIGVESDPNLHIYLLIYPHETGRNYTNGWWVNEPVSIFSGGKWSGWAYFGLNETYGNQTGDRFDLAAIVTGHELEPWKEAYSELPSNMANYLIQNLTRI